MLPNQSDQTNAMISDDLQACFDPVIKSIVGLIEGQKAAAAKERAPAIAVSRSGRILGHIHADRSRVLCSWGEFPVPCMDGKISRNGVVKVFDQFWQTGLKWRRFLRSFDADTRSI